MAEDLPKAPTTTILGDLEASIRAKSQYHLFREGVFRGVLKASSVKSFDFARYCNTIPIDQADEGSFFISSALRGICEDVIALKFLLRLNRKQRDEVVSIAMLMAVRRAIAAQAAFFKKLRPFQPVLQEKTNPEEVKTQKERLTAIGRSSGLWNTQGKLPPIEQMADKVALRPMYDYFYRITSDIVHFSPRIAMRSGWGPNPRDAKFATKNFARYYLNFAQCYSVYLFALLCKTFRRDLILDSNFTDQIKQLEQLLDEQLRWPEAVTFEEMNVQGPDNILWVLHAYLLRTEDWEKGATRSYQRSAAARKRVIQLPWRSVIFIETVAETRLVWARTRCGSVCCLKSRNCVGAVQRITNEKRRSLLNRGQ